MSQKRAKEERRIRRQNLATSQERLDSEPLTVTGCTGTKEHYPSCDGTCELQELEDDLVLALNVEEYEWHKAGMNVNNIVVDGWHNELVQNAIIKLLCEKDYITQEEADRAYRTERLERMRMIREANQEAVTEARRRAQIAASPVVLPSSIRRDRLH